MANQPVHTSDDQQLRAFTALLEREPDLAAQLNACSAPEQILALASSKGCPFSRDALRAQSANLAAPHWPWAGKGSTWRRDFFNT